MLKKIFLILLLTTACERENKQPVIVIETGEGEMEIALYPDKAPQTVAAFLRYIDSGYYVNSNFYRVLSDENQPSNSEKTELIQGGIWRTKKGKEAATVKHESTAATGLRHVRGTLSLARREPGTASTEFFICVEDAPGLDSGGSQVADQQGYAAFGKLIRGFDVLKKIYRKNESNQYFDPPVPIYGIKRK